MNLSEMILPEFDREMANTRKTLERVPEDKFAWKPHEKSTSLGGLTTQPGEHSQLDQEHFRCGRAGHCAARRAASSSRGSKVTADSSDG